MAQIRAATPSTYHLLLPSGMPPLLPIPLPAPHTSRRADIPEADTPPQKRLLLTAPRPRGEKDRAAVRAEIGILRRERLAYEKESIETRQTLARSEAYSRALEEWITALEAGARVDTLEDTGNSRIMATVNQGMSVEEIKQIIAQRVANAIEAIAIYESINQTKQRENKVVGNASNKRKWEGDQNGSLNQQQNKEHKVFRAHSVGPNYQKEYIGSLPLCNKCKFHHIGLCAARCENCKWRCHQARDCRISGPKTKPRPSLAKLKAEVTYVEVRNARNGFKTGKLCSEPHPAYDFFTPGPLPGYAGNPNNNNGWIEVDVPLLGELGVVADEPMVGPIVDEIAEPIVEAEEQVIALVIDMDEDIAILFGDDDFEDDDSEGFDE
ncbi:hypothetical protein Tco_0859704 [Tanacetum coccineum]|uniref:Uncharacterized protein n=1 Tax=Tanacetum coccineum TaxID=301880 RepID=A0ABQ5BF14_9ASTR